MNDNAPHARTIWPSLEYLATWIGCNCYNCRWRHQPKTIETSDSPCHVPHNAITAWIANAPTKDTTATTIFGHRYLNARSSYTLAPNRCASRKDNRGRPATAERTNLG
jgi:hypothetical protein